MDVDDPLAAHLKQADTRLDAYVGRLPGDAKLWHHWMRFVAEIIRPMVVRSESRVIEATMSATGNALADQRREIEQLQARVAKLEAAGD